MRLGRWFLVAALVPCMGVRARADAPRWALLLYWCADDVSRCDCGAEPETCPDDPTCHEKRMIAALNSVLAAEADDSVRIYVLVDRARADGFEGPVGEEPASDLALCYEVRGKDVVPSKVCCPSTAVDCLDDEVCTGDSGVLRDFIAGAVAEAKAEQNALVIMGHGAADLGTGEDGTSYGNLLEPGEMQEAILDAKASFEFLGLHSCLMGSYEALLGLIHEKSLLAEHAVACELGIEEEDWPYAEMLAAMKESGSDGRAVTDAVVAAFAPAGKCEDDTLRGLSGPVVGLDLGHLDTVRTEVEGLSKALTQWLGDDEQTAERFLRPEKEPDLPRLGRASRYVDLRFLADRCSGVTSPGDVGTYGGKLKKALDDLVRCRRSDGTPPGTFALSAYLPAEHISDEVLSPYTSDGQVPWGEQTGWPSLVRKLSDVVQPRKAQAGLPTTKAENGSYLVEVAVKEGAGDGTARTRAVLRRSDGLHLGAMPTIETRTTASFRLGFRWDETWPHLVRGRAGIPARVAQVRFLEWSEAAPGAASAYMDVDVEVSHAGRGVHRLLRFYVLLEGARVLDSRFLYALEPHELGERIVPLDPAAVTIGSGLDALPAGRPSSSRGACDPVAAAATPLRLETRRLPLGAYRLSFRLERLSGGPVESETASLPALPRVAPR